MKFFVEYIYYFQTHPAKFHVRSKGELVWVNKS